jgi:hypothetical protein
MGCKTSGSESKAIIGQDDLNTNIDAALLKKIGKIQSKKGHCTFFVSGKNEIATAKHCVMGYRAQDLLFEVNGQKIDVPELSYKNDGIDFVKLKTLQDMPEIFEFSVLEEGQPASIVGFTGRFEQHTNCRLSSMKESKAYFLHECDTRSGMSGAPIIQNGRVIAMHLGHAREANKNFAINAMAMNGAMEAFPFRSFIEEGTRCGSKSSALGTAYKELTTDWWPDMGPISVLMTLGFGVGVKTIADLGCATIGQAYLGQGCGWHDNCYDGFFSPQINDRTSCDMGLRDRWVEACKSRYKKDGPFDIAEIVKAPCREYCVKTVEFMYHLQSKGLADQANQAWYEAAGTRAINTAANGPQPALKNGQPASLYVVQNQRLHCLNVDNEYSGYEMVGDGNWVGATSMTVLNGEIYIIQNNRLHRVNRIATDWQVVGDASWDGATQIASIGNSLYIIQNASLHRVDPASGSYQVLGGQVWAGATSMTAHSGNLYIIQAGNLHRVNPADGGWAVIGPQSTWSGTTRMTAMGGSLYVIQNGTLHAVNPSDGNYAVVGSGNWSGSSTISAARGLLYIIQHGFLHRVNPANGRWEVLGPAEWGGTTLTSAFDSLCNQ